LLVFIQLFNGFQNLIENIVQKLIALSFEFFIPNEYSIIWVNIGYVVRECILHLRG